MSDEEQECEECIPGLPAWMGTFADLMSLLMCFFVLLLSFSEMDVLKFKRLAGSMREAFGVQNQVDVTAVPTGTSIIAQEFSPGRPEPTPLQMVMQSTVDSSQQSLEVLCEAEIEKAASESCTQAESSQEKEDMKVVVAKKIEQLNEDAEGKAVDIADKLQDEIAEEIVEIETRGRKIIIRVQEKGTFSSGSAELESDFFPVLDKLIEILKTVEGGISVEGHSDNIPIQTAEFPSNWDLSVARALEVAQGLFGEGELDQGRFSVAGFADTKPIVPNDTSENRAKNRRVEIVLQEKSDSEVKAELKAEIKEVDEVLEEDNIRELDQIFELDPNEIF